jgi:hypothetical protein
VLRRRSIIGTMIEPVLASLMPKSVALAQARQAAGVSRCGAQADQARTVNRRPPAILLNLPACFIVSSTKQLC